MPKAVRSWMIDDSSSGVFVAQEIIGPAEIEQRQIFCSPAAASLYHRSSAELQGKSLATVLPLE